MIRTEKLRFNGWFTEKRIVLESPALIPANNKTIFFTDAVFFVAEKISPCTIGAVGLYFFSEHLFSSQSESLFVIIISCRNLFVKQKLIQIDKKIKTFS